MKGFLYESPCHLAVSLHNLFDDERTALMLVNKAHPIKDIINKESFMTFITMKISKRTSENDKVIY